MVLAGFLEEAALHWGFEGQIGREETEGLGEAFLVGEAA